MKLTGKSREENDLRKWLRAIPVAERVDFIKQLWPQNGRFALSLVRTSQLPIDDASAILRHWLSLGQHSAAKGLIQTFQPLLGEKRFWRIAAAMQHTSGMEDFLNYYGRGQLQRYREV